MCLLVSFTHAGENTPPYYYGTHYSSAMIVASFLIRMEPFTQHFLKLQVGLFEYLYVFPFTSIPTLYPKSRVVILIFQIVCFTVSPMLGGQPVKPTWLMSRNSYQSSFTYQNFLPIPTILNWVSSKLAMTLW